jgi:hypothetical protein
MMRAALLLAAALLAPLAHGAVLTAADDAPPPAGAAAASAVQQDELYLSALRALADGHPDEAAELLARLIEREPRHAGAWLDLAISKCELGQAAEAERLFQETERQFKPPPAIIEVIARHRAGGCPGISMRPASWSLSVGRGHDSNANQGPSNSSFETSIGTVGLAPEFQPQADTYSALTADYYKPLDPQGTLALVQLRGRAYDRVHAQDNTTLQAAVERPWQWGSWRSVGTGSIGAVRLNSALYQRQAQLQLRLVPPLSLPDHYDLAFSTSLSHVQYPTRVQYDANTSELSGMLNYRGAHTQVQLALGALDDHGRDARPGGNRQGWYASLQWYKQLGEHVNLEAGLNHQDWRSARAYLPGLVDQLRRQQTDTARLAMLYPVWPHQQLLLEWRATRNRENISLLQYNSRAFQLSWRWDNF